MTDTSTLGLLLAGGLARRMGGGDKPLRTIAGRSILAHVIERLAPQCGGLVINANGDPARFADYGLPVVADSVPDFAGPLAGILAGLDWMADNRPGPNGSSASPPTRPSSRVISSPVCTRRARSRASRSPAPPRAAGRIR